MNCMKHLKNILFTNIKILLILILIIILGIAITGCSHMGYTDSLMEEKIILNNKLKNISEIYNEILINFDEYIDKYSLAKIGGSFIKNSDGCNISYKQLKFSFIRYVNGFGEEGLYSEIYIMVDMGESTATIKEYLIDGKASSLPSTELILEEDTVGKIEKYLFENSIEKEQIFDAWMTISSIDEVIKPGELKIEVYSKSD